MCGVTNPPVTPPPLTSARPTVDSQQETGQDRRTKEKGGGGRGVCGSVDHGSLVAREREMQEARGSTEKISPPPTQEKRGNTRENTARGTHPPRGKRPREPGEGQKHGKGRPTNPEERKKAPLGKEEPEEEKRQNVWGCHALLKASRRKLFRGNVSSYSPSRCGGRCPPSHVNTPNETKAATHEPLQSFPPYPVGRPHVIEKNKSLGRCTPHPGGDPEKPEQEGTTRPEA